MTKGPLVRQPDAAEPLRANRQASPLVCRPLVSRLSCGHFQHDRHESGSGGCGVEGRRMMSRGGVMETGVTDFTGLWSRA